MAPGHKTVLFYVISLAGLVAASVFFTGQSYGDQPDSLGFAAGIINRRFPGGEPILL